ncbi:MAG: retroviral-like aspartic protease family protein [Desulfuromonadaceae bacterium]|nr:retroviral-like aspartic protease family protein [Desulfuromonadaceae bacterium]
MMRAKPPNHSVTKPRIQPWAVNLCPLPLLLLGLLMQPQASHSEIHSYVDEQGTRIFVDDAYLSPTERRGLQQRVLDSENAQRKSLSTPVKVYGNQVLVPVELSDGNRQVRAQLLLDTGASQTVFYRRTVVSLRTKFLGKGWSRLAGGQLIATERVRLAALQVGPYTWKTPAVYLIDLNDSDAPFDGLLGMDFLRQHHYRIDFQQQLIHWQPTD